jgi:hypothetical protein
VGLLASGGRLVDYAISPALHKTSTMVEELATMLSRLPAWNLLPNGRRAGSTTCGPGSTCGRGASAAGCGPT